MMTCATCRHWDQTANNTSALLRAHDGRGECQRVASLPAYQDSYDELPANGAELRTDEGESRLETAPDFGCTLHEAKR